MDHRATSLKFLTATGLIPVKVMPGQKDPAPEDWDPRRIAGRDHTLTIAQLQHNPKLNLGALFAGRYVDVDVDTTNRYIHAALDYFLPKTPYEWGRKSKPRSHRVYTLFEDFDRAIWGNLLNYIKHLLPGEIDDQSYSIEVRGGKPENGLFTVLPGSYRADVDENVEWSHKLDPTVSGAHIKIEDLIRGIRLALVAAMVAPHWTSGVRNDMSLAMAGTLWRIRHSTMAAHGLEADEDPPEGFYVLSEDDAKSLFRGIMEMAGDDKLDERSRLLNLQTTFRKLNSEAGARVTGGKALAELIGGDVGKRVISKMYRLLSDNDAAEEVERAAERYVVWYGQGLLIDLHEVKKDNPSPWMTKQQAVNSLGGKRLSIGGNKIPLVNVLFGSSIIDRVYGLTFDPSNPNVVVETPQGLKVNQWRGFAVEPSTQRILDEQVKPFIDYVETILANGDKKIAHWIMAWLADVFQYPADKSGTALVLVGVEGAGKTFLGEFIMGPLIGPAHYVQVGSVGTLTHNFNMLIDNKIFLQADESKHSEQRLDASRLRSMVTDKTLTIEPKGVNAYKKPNHMRFLLTSNEEHKALYISSDPNERRFTVVKVSENRAHDRGYWTDMHYWMPANLPRVMRWLMDYRYEKWDIKRPLATVAKRELQQIGLDVEVSWILSRIAAGFPLDERTHKYWYQAYKNDQLTERDKHNNVLRRDYWPDRIVVHALEEDYKMFVRGHGKPIYSGSVITTIRKVLPPNALALDKQVFVRYVDSKTGQVVHTRQRFYHWPTIEELMSHLMMRYGSAIADILEQIRKDNEGFVHPTDSDEKEREY